MADEPENLTLYSYFAGVSRASWPSAREVVGTNARFHPGEPCYSLARIHAPAAKKRWTSSTRGALLRRRHARSINVFYWSVAVSLIVSLV